MVKVEYDYRILCDASFFEYTMKHVRKAEITSRMMHIKANSKHHKKRHNLILKSEYDTLKIPEEKLTYGIKAAAKKDDDPDFLLNEQNQVNRNVKFAINLTSEIPYRCYIFTSPDKEKEYLRNPHYRNHQLTTVRILSGENAFAVVDSYYKKLRIEQQMAR